jgi:uncharacterized protein with NAD-binding domain and iron-sulfur cluster
VEFHLYDIKKEWVHIHDPKKLWELVNPVAFGIYPELKDMTAIGFTLGEHENFPSYALKQEYARPSTNYPSTIGIENLVLAGDWLKTSYPAALMEKAVITGREAANHILLKDNVRQAEVVVTNSHGPGLI